MAEGMRIISIAFREAPRTMFPPGSGVDTQGPDHLTFDLADNSKVSLSFYGKRDAMRGDHTLFTTAEGIESLWERSEELLDNPPVAKMYPAGSWGPNAIHQLIAPKAWRLPFEREWRENKRARGD